ncbi:zinc ribbon domain-containing protein [Streptosporangium sandarakinum]
MVFTAIFEPVPGPGTGEVIGVERGVAVSAALPTGELLNAPPLRESERLRLRRLLRKLARAGRGSDRRARVKRAIAALKAREVDRRKDRIEKTGTDLARRSDVTTVGDHKIGDMTRSARGTIDVPGRNVRAKAGLNRGILAAGRGRLVARPEHKAPGRVQKTNPHYTSQTCDVCGRIARERRESQALFRCVACGH